MVGYINRGRSLSNRGYARILVVLIVTALISLQGIAALGSQDPNAVPNAIEPRSVAEQYPLWIDLLDDLTHVYVLPTGLAGVEVADGVARLSEDKTEGWFASTIISCPVGYRYDFVWIEADLPGDSYIEVSLLNAMEESTVVGFANETIPGFVRKRSTEASVYNINPNKYPHTRIQVDLHADGDDRPRVLSWALYFVGEEEWIDDFIGMGKMVNSKGIVLDGGQMSLDHNRKGASSGPIEYPKFPTVALMVGSSSSYFYAYYGDTAGSTYNNYVTVSSNRTQRMMFDDLNSDGYLDLLLANGASSSYYSEIWWGTSSGTLSPTGKTVFPVYGAYGIDSGDFNGDGSVDVVLAIYGSGSGSAVFYGDGTTSFSSTPDVTLPYYFYVKAGDVNGDGYDDCVFWDYSGGNYYTRVHLGGASGVSTTADITLNTGAQSLNHMIVEDVDGDDYADVVAARQGQQYVFLGSVSGPGSNPDYSLNPTNGYGYKCGAGDVNGDGLGDLVFLSSNVIDVYEGTSSGWSDSNKHAINVGSTTYALVVADVDKDGYDDVVSQGNSGLEVYQGSSSWSFTRIISKTSPSSSQDMAIAIPKGPTARNFTGHFETQSISLPLGKKWDVLDLSARMEPNTTLRITLLDYRGKAITGFDNVTAKSLDISHLTQSSLRVRIDISSELNTTSPWLDRLTVTWIDKMSWMDRFYGMTRVDRLFGLTVSGGVMRRSAGEVFGPTLVFPSLLGDPGGTPPSLAFTDSGALDYADNPPIELGAKGVSAVDCADINGDGFLDLAFAVYKSGTSYVTKSPVYLGSAVGWRDTPDLTLPTVGARDILLRDLNRDGHIDIVYAQETDGSSYSQQSELFWGSASGFNSTADVTFDTTGATDVEAADIDGDGLLDLVFACGRSTSSACDSMVFLQMSTGFAGSSPSYRLPTHSASAVAVGDLDGNGWADVVFANNFSTGTVEIDSYIYWGQSGGSLDPTPTGIRTVGASDVVIADVDVDGDLDLVFANRINNEGQYEVDSYIYLNGGGGTYQAVPEILLPTTGASAVAVVDIDGTGWKDLVFASYCNSTSLSQYSLVYLGGSNGYGANADMRLPTEGASDALAIPMGTGHGGYLSEPISPENPSDVGNFHTLSYMASIGTSHSISIQLIDASTWDVIAEESLEAGMHEWRVGDLFRFKEHKSVRVAIVATGLDASSELFVDNLRINWTKRTPMPPKVNGIDVSETQVLRGDQVTFVINASDEFDPSADLGVVLQHRNAGGSWQTYMIGTPVFKDGVWQATFTPRLDSEVGWYDLRVRVFDSDVTYSEFAHFPSLVKILNNLPTTPSVQIIPYPARTNSTLKVEITESSRDRESYQLSYRYRWYLDGMPVDELTTDMVAPTLTSRGQNWSVEVWAYDGLDEGLPGLAWSVVHNSAPHVHLALQSIHMVEDTVDSTSLDLMNAFVDDDGDPISWMLATVPSHLNVQIDPSTGAVRVSPEAEWSGEELLVFVGSDGELEAKQSIMVTVEPVNDAPRFSTIDGQPIIGSPVRLTVFEDETMTVQLDAFDVEGSEFRFSCNLSRFEIDIRTGELSFTPNNDDVGTINLAVTVWEVAHQDVTSRLELVIVVVNVNDPMETPRIIKPDRGSLFKEDETIQFQGSCDDPDTFNGQVLNFTWSSDISGVLGYGPEFQLDGLIPGNHTITLTVRDLEYDMSTSLSVDVEALEGPPIDDNDDEPSVGQGTSMLLLLIVILVLAVIVVDVYIVAGRRRRAVPESPEDHEAKEMAPVEVTFPVPPPPSPTRGSGLVLEEVSTGTMVWRPSAPPPTDVPATPTYGSPYQPQPQTPPLYIPPPGPEPVTPLPMDLPDLGVPGMDADEVAIALEEREVMEALTQLPQGLPTSLGNWDMAALARTVLSGEKKTLPDGTELVNINGQWYNADRTNVGRFMREHKEPKTPKISKRSENNLEDRLDMLEQALLEGKISEKTYMELKAKYEKQS